MMNVALRLECVDRNIFCTSSNFNSCWSHSVWSAWIEIRKSGKKSGSKASHSVWSAWIEIAILARP